MTIRFGRMRKFLAVALLGVVEAAAYVAADPRNLPSWVVTGALAVNAAAVFFVRNDLPTRDELLARLNEHPAASPTRHVRGKRPVRGGRDQDPGSTIP